MSTKPRDLTVAPHFDFESCLYLQLVEGFGFSSTLIALCGLVGSFSHAAALVDAKTLIDSRDDSVGGQPPGVHERPQDYQRWRRKLIMEFHIGAVHVREANAWLRKQLGDQYDPDAILGFIEGNTRLHMRGRWICSALQGGRLVVAGVFPRLPFALHEIDPDVLYAMGAAAHGRVVYDSRPNKPYPRAPRTHAQAA